MKDVHQAILHTFLPDRIHHNRRIAQRTGIIIYDVSNSTEQLSKQGYLEKVILPSKARGSTGDGRRITNYFRLTESGRKLAQEYEAKYEVMRNRIAELVASGMDPREAVITVAVDSVESDITTS